MIAAALAVVLAALAVLHGLWAIGVWWPIRDEAALARAVVGRPGITRMPGAVPSALVVVALLWAAAWPWLGPDLGPGLNRAGLIALTLVFAAARRCRLAARLAPDLAGTANSQDSTAGAMVRSALPSPRVSPRF